MDTSTFSKDIGSMLEANSGRSREKKDDGVDRGTSLCMLLCVI